MSPPIRICVSVFAKFFQSKGGPGHQTLHGLREVRLERLLGLLAPGALCHFRHQRAQRLCIERGLRAPPRDQCCSQSPMGLGR